MAKKESLLERTINKVLCTRYSRKSFLWLLSIILGALLFASNRIPKLLAKTTKKLSPRQNNIAQTPYDLVVVKGKDPGAITRLAIEHLGGMGAFVKKGDIVVVKPNIGWDRAPEYAANTNPEVVEAIVKMCYEAGAKVVKMFDNTCNESSLTYQKSGIQYAAKNAGGTVYHTDEWKFYPGAFSKGAAMEDWPVFRDAVLCDCFINVPIAKHHSLTKLTLSMKNLMGVCGGERGMMHWNISKKLAEITQFMKPNLTIIDAYRILTKHGPSGGDLADVKLTETVIASTDPVLADSYATTLFGLTPSDIGYIKKGHEMGLGNMDIAKARIKTVTV